MIDIHTHILPGLDDGATDVEEALAMARAAAGDGVAELVATPHAGDQVTASSVRAKVDYLQAELDRAAIPVRLHVGVEVWLSPEVLGQRAAGKAFPIGSGTYMLIELPLQAVPAYTEQTIFALQVAGVRPILAHPERCAGIEDHRDILYRLVERGVLGQLTAGSLLGAFGPRTKALAESMLSAGLVHVIASDAHSPTQRPPVLAAAVARAAFLIGNDRAQAMVTTIPQRIVGGLTVDVPEPAARQPKRSRLPWRR